MRVGRWVSELQAMVFEWPYRHKYIPVKSVQLLWQCSPSNTPGSIQSMLCQRDTPTLQRSQQSEEAKDSSRKETWRLLRKDKGREAHVVFTFNSSPKLHFWELLLHPGHIQVCLKPQFSLDTEFSFSYIQLPVQSWQTQSWHLQPYAPALVWRVSPPHRDTGSSCTNTSE